jgi:hypothetical protein
MVVYVYVINHLILKKSESRAVLSTQFSGGLTNYMPTNITKKKWIKYYFRGISQGKLTL